MSAVTVGAKVRTVGEICGLEVVFSGVVSWVDGDRFAVVYPDDSDEADIFDAATMENDFGAVCQIL